jgi:uncharacterized cupin superfamily protein
MAEKSVVRGLDVAPKIGSRYPLQFAGPCQKREKRAVGDFFGLTQFGANLTTLPPGAWSALRHWHENEDEFVYVIEGDITLIDDSGEHPMGPGDCAGFRAGVRNGHHLVNKSEKPASYIEIGTRAPTERGAYADVDMRFEYVAGEPVRYTRKDGTPY